ncbi:hypothetical protein [Salinisphaera sp. T31B1]|uniref:hypothetical protein n=1 Tax=Salinisphaera sp. T31B1 TaxID=727963 RepID=UPI00333E7C04
MSVTRSLSIARLLAVLLGAVCLGLILWAGAQASTALVEARTAKLYVAEQGIAQATAPLIQQDRIPNSLVRRVQMLVDDPALNLSFVTVRNAANITLVSRGRLGETGLSWVPVGSGQAWRGWLYRLGSAEANRAVMRDGERVGVVHFGVPWTGVFYRAGFPLFIWATALLAGAIGLLGAALRLTSPTASPAVTAASPHGRPTRSSRKLSGGMSRLSPRRRRNEAEFEPIAPTSGYGAASPSAPERHPVTEPAPADAYTAGRAVGATAPAPPPPVPSPSRTGPAQAAVPVQDAVPAAPSNVAGPRAASSPVFEAPQLDARPTLGDSTLDLRFFPIWRGAGADRELAGARAAMAWRAGDAELVDPATLTRLAEREGALRAFTQWIARRLSMLHGNWRTLELPTVPIVLPIPSAMLGFADAEAVWRDALRRTDRDPDDLVLALEDTASATRAALPLRRSLPLRERDRMALPHACDLLSLSPERVNDDDTDWCRFFDTIEASVLFGPVDDPERYTEMLGHARVLWFSERDSEVRSPRSFARLLARHPVAAF